MGIQIKFSTDKQQQQQQQQQCFAGDIVEGVVHVNVISTNAEGSSADRLMLRLVGLAKTRIVRSQGSTSRSIEQENKFLFHETQLASFGGRVTAGSHRFPFSFVLPPSLPPSMKEKGGSKGDCSIAYVFEARLHRPGFLKFDSKATLELKVLSRPQETPAPTPVLVGPETQIVKTCCCFNSGSMSIGFEADRSVVGINEPVSLTVVARSDSSSWVKSMHVEIVQVCTWYARGEKDTKTRTIASVITPGSQLGEVQRAAEIDPYRPKPAVREVFAAGAGTRYEISVPEGSLLTLQTALIEVRHSLHVRLKTPALNSTPDVWMPLHVQAETVEVGPPAEAEAVGLPSAVAVLCATPVGGAEPGGDLKSVVVPQSAVTMEFSSGFPQASAPANGQFPL